MQMKRLRFLSGLLFVIILLFPSFIPYGISEEVTITWNPNSEPDLDGYSVYRRSGSSGPPYDWVSDVYLDELPDPDNPEVTMTNLKEDNNYYIAITAFDEAGNESNYSKEICVKIEESAIIDCTPESKSDGGGGGGGGGGG